MADYPRGAVSHSQVSGYIRCGKQFELERIAHYPAPPTWYFIGGNAVHAATEFLDQHFTSIDTVDEQDVAAAWAAAYDHEIEQEFLRWPADEEWLKFGRRGSHQDYDYWNDRGLAGVQAYVDWRKAHPEMLLESVEESFTVDIDGIILTGRIDRVFQTPAGRIIVDIKAGSRRPTTALQIGLYRLGYDLSHGASEESLVASGGYFMTKDGELFLQDIDQFSRPVLKGMLSSYLEGVRNDVFLPNIGEGCFLCPVSKACAAVSGPTKEALQYDSLLRS